METVAGCFAKYFCFQIFCLPRFSCPLPSPLVLTTNWKHHIEKCYWHFLIFCFEPQYYFCFGWHGFPKRTAWRLVATLESFENPCWAYVVLLSDLPWNFEFCFPVLLLLVFMKFVHSINVWKLSNQIAPCFWLGLICQFNKDLFFTSPVSGCSSWLIL